MSIFISLELSVIVVAVSILYNKVNKNIGLYRIIIRLRPPNLEFLPQINPHGGTYFVNYCLHETISQPKIKQLIQKHQTHLEELRKQSQTTSEQIDVENRKYFKKLDQQIHQAKGAHYLKNEKVAQITANFLHFWDGKKIDLMAFCIMSNHVHLVLRLLESEKRGSIPLRSPRIHQEILRISNQLDSHSSFPIFIYTLKLKTNGY